MASNPVTCWVVLSAVLMMVKKLRFLLNANTFDPSGDMTSRCPFGTPMVAAKLPSAMLTAYTASEVGTAAYAVLPSGVPTTEETAPGRAAADFCDSCALSMNDKPLPVASCVTTIVIPVPAAARATGPADTPTVASVIGMFPAIGVTKLELVNV